MTANSINTFHSTKEIRETHKQKVFECLKKESNQSRFEVGRKLEFGDIEAQRRISDLINDGKVIITGSRKHFEREISLYSIKQQLELYPAENKPNLRQWLNDNYPEILHKFEVLILKKL